MLVLVLDFAGEFEDEDEDEEEEGASGYFSQTLFRRRLPPTSPSRRRLRKNRLAGRGGVWLISEEIKLQADRKYFPWGRVSKAAWAVLLTFLLIFSCVVAFEPGHGKAHHGDRSTDQCVLCAFAHGQVHAAEPEVGLRVGGRLLVALLLPAPPAAGAPADYRLSPSRAPPLFTLLPIR